ncbi:hypothetical protein [Gordonia neofelifaecis]|uniref:Uncharacterized protein n=1 Tax=Gordonia neofelifaecis NRRL B-59395 TaxID=644548 RepID=F1YF75_9ACTN|nr:hypothetical protein [Gordonia neofelifaecis]EGD56614.1 hypothetical protein SCNU_03647 [Gordonia neofelifaecis NRRL B-59395]
MEAVEVNAGAWYLRALRHDDRLSDVPALELLGVTDPVGYIRAADAGWADESGLTWAVCVPTTGELAAVIGVDASGTLSGVSRDQFDDALVAAVDPASRCAAALLDVVPSPLRTALPGR